MKYRGLYIVLVIILVMRKLNYSEAKKLQFISKAIGLKLSLISVENGFNLEVAK